MSNENIDDELFYLNPYNPYYYNLTVNGELTVFRSLSNLIDYIKDRELKNYSLKVGSINCINCIDGVVKLSNISDITRTSTLIHLLFVFDRCTDLKSINPFQPIRSKYDYFNNQLKYIYKLIELVLKGEIDLPNSSVYEIIFRATRFLIATSNKVKDCVELSSRQYGTIDDLYRNWIYEIDTNLKNTLNLIGRSINDKERKVINLFE